MALLTNIDNKFSVSDAGAVTFNDAFTFPTADGTANYVLKTNGSGQLAWAADNGDITGSGTANTVTKFTGAKTIGNGPITFSSNNSSFSGSVTINDDAGVIIYTTTNAVDAKINFSSLVPGYAQIGTIAYNHTNTLSYGSDESFVIRGTETTMTILADGKLMYKEGVYLKPATGTGAGTRKDNLWDAAYNDKITGLAVTGTTTKTLTATQQDGGTLTATWADNDGGGTVTGSGTANTMPVWTSASALGDSIITTGSPAGQATVGGVLNVTGNSNFQGSVDVLGVDDIRVRFLNSTTFKAGLQVPTTAGDMITNSAVDDFCIRSQTNTLFSTGGSIEKMRITSDGKVGIATNLPQAPLHVVTSTDLSDALILEFAGTSQGGPYQTFQYNEGGFAPSEDGDLIGGIRARAAYAAGTYAGYSTAIEFRNDAAISSTSNPGRILFKTSAVNGVTPLERMSISSNGFGYFYNNFYLASAANQGNLFFGTADPLYNIFGGGTYGYMGYNTSGYHRFLTSGTERLRIAADGVIQITSGINGYINTNSIGMEMDINRNPETGAFTDAALSHARIIMRGDTVANGGSNIKFATSPDINTVGTTKMTILGDGNVGIGTVDPDQKLEVVGSIKIANANSRLVFGAENGTDRRALEGNTAGSLLQVGESYDDIAIQGFALINTTTDRGGQLQVYTSDTSGSIRIGGGNNTGESRVFIESAGNGSYIDSFGDSVYQDLKIQAAVLSFQTSGSTARCVDMGTATWRGYGSNPIAKLNIEVAGGNALNIYNTDENEAFLRFIDSQSNNSQAAYFSFNSSTNIFSINNMGYSATISTAGNWTFPATITATSDVVAYSDKRLKSNIKTLDGSKVYNMRGVSFDKDGKKGSGVIAQELEEIAPELVNSDSEYKAVAYGNITGYLIEAIKELKAEIEELKLNNCNCK